MWASLPPGCSPQPPQQIIPAPQPAAVRQCAPRLVFHLFLLSSIKNITNTLNRCPMPALHIAPDSSKQESGFNRCPFASIVILHLFNLTFNSLLFSLMLSRLSAHKKALDYPLHHNSYIFAPTRNGSNLFQIY